MRVPRAGKLNSKEIHRREKCVSFCNYDISAFRECG